MTLIDINKTYRLRRGDSVRVLATDLPDSLPVAIWSEFAGLLSRYADGRYLKHVDSSLDLVEVVPTPIPVTTYHNVYSSHVNAGYRNLVDVKSVAGLDTLGQIAVTITFNEDGSWAPTVGKA